MAASRKSIEFSEENETFNEVSPTPDVSQLRQYLCLVAHQPLRNCVHRVEDEQLCHTCKVLCCELRYLYCRVGIPEVPDPRTRAVPDSEPPDEGEGDIFGQGELQVVGRAGSEVTRGPFSLRMSIQIFRTRLGSGMTRRSSNPRLTSATAFL